MATAVEPAAIDGAVVFTDLAGFTEFTALRGDAEALAMLNLQAQIVGECLPPGARLVKELGDGLLLWFPDAASAIRTMVTLQERFDAASGESGYPFWVRMGAHWGRQVPRGADVVGHDVNLASRIVNVAAPGEILVSDATRAEARDIESVAYEEVGPVVMKGIPGAVRLFRAVPAA